MSIKQVANGRMVDLLDPQTGDIDFGGWIAETLARTPRFGGAIRGGILSGAQHMTIGTRAILRDTGDRDLAAAFLLHDAHEAFVGDLTTPTAGAIADEVYRQVRDRDFDADEAAEIRRAVVDAIAEIKDRLDEVIYPAAGLPWPLPASLRDRVKVWDARMLETERRLFLGAGEAPWAWDDDPPLPIRWPEKARIWPWPEASAAWLATLHDLCPDTRPLAD